MGLIASVRIALFRPAGGRFLIFLFGLALSVRVANALALSGDESWFRAEDSGEYLKGVVAWLERGGILGFLEGGLVLVASLAPSID